MVAVAETDAVGVLDQFDAVEDPAADICRPLEGIASRSSDDEGVLTRLEPAGQAVKSVVAEQAAADGRHGDVSNVQVDEGVARIALFRTRGGSGIVRLFKDLVDVINRKDQAADGTVTDKALPVANFTLRGIDRLRNSWRRASGHAALTAEPTALDELGGRTNDAVAHYQDGDRRTADDIDLRRGGGTTRDAVHIGADQLVDGFQNALFRNAEQHDGLFVLNKLEAGQHPLGRNADQKLDWFAGIARRIGKVGVQVDEAEKLIVLVGAHNRGIALQRAKTIRLRNQFSRLGLAKVIAQPPRGARFSKKGNPAANGQNSQKGIGVNGFGQVLLPDFSRTPLFWTASSMINRAANRIATCAGSNCRQSVWFKLLFRENPTCAKSRF